MNQFSNEVLDAVAPDLSAFSRVEARPLEIDISRTKTWVVLIGLIQTIGPVRFKGEAEGVLRQYVRRVCAAINSYEELRCDLNRYFTDHFMDSPKFNFYFSALDAVENCLWQLQMAAESLNKSILKDVESKIENDELTICLSLVNHLKHFGERADTGRASDILPLWFSREGVTNGVAYLELSQIAEIIEGLTEFAAELLFPSNSGS